MVQITRIITLDAAGLAQQHAGYRWNSAHVHLSELDVKLVKVSVDSVCFAATGSLGKSGHSACLRSLKKLGQYLFILSGFLLSCFAERCVAVSNGRNMFFSVRELSRFYAGVLLFLLLGGCTGGRTVVNITDDLPSGIEIGKEIILLSQATEKVSAHMTRDGRVHMIAITKSGAAWHIVVSERGIEEKNRVGNIHHGYYESLAITSDEKDRIHLAIKDEYWIWDKGNWEWVGNNRCVLMSGAGNSVACIIEASGKELGTAAEWGIMAFGGGPAGVIIPYRKKPAKVVIAEGTNEAWSYRNVLDYHLVYFVNLDNVGTAVLAGDITGRQHLFFQAYEGSYYHFRYATMTFSKVEGGDVEFRPSDGQPALLMNSESEAIFVEGWFITASPPHPFAVDPQTGKALFIVRKSTSFANWVDAGVEIQGKLLGQPIAFPVPTSQPMRLAPAGDEQFHALLGVNRTLLYATYRSGEWSAITKLGEYGKSGLFVIASASIQIASDGRPQALAIWPQKEGKLVGRWIQFGKQK